MSKENKKNIWQKARESAERTKNPTDAEKKNHVSNIKTIRKPKIFMGVLAGIINILFWGLGSIILGKNMSLHFIFFLMSVFIKLTNYENVYTGFDESLPSLFFIISIFFGAYGLYQGINNYEVVIIKSESKLKDKNIETPSKIKNSSLKGIKPLLVSFMFIIGIAVNFYIIQNPHQDSFLDTKNISSSEVEELLFQTCMNREDPYDGQKLFCSCYVDSTLSKWSVDEIIAINELSEPTQEILDFREKTFELCFNRIIK